MTRYVACLTLLLAIPGFCLADDPPDSEINPQTGFIETVTTVWNGSDRDVRVSIDRSELPPISEELVAGSTEDVGPRIAIASSGAATVVWTRDGSIGEIRVRTRTGSEWGSDWLISEASEDSRNPEIINDGAATRVVYEIHESTSISVAVGVIGDEPDPFGMRTIVASGAASGDVDARIHAESEHVWVTWVHDSSAVGWCELSGSSWTQPAYESYSGSDTESTYADIRGLVLGD